MSSKNIEAFMDRADEWTIHDLDARVVVDQHAAVDLDAEVIEVDEESTPDEARRSAAAAQQSQVQHRKKKLLAVLAVAGAVLGAVIFVAWAWRPTPGPTNSIAAPNNSSAPAVQSQFIPPRRSDGQDPASAPTAPAPTHATIDPAPAVQPVAAPVAGLRQPPAPGTPESGMSEADLKAKQDRIARLERENKKLKERLTKATAMRSSAGAMPKRYGADVHRIYVDGIVLINNRGEQVPVAIGEMAAKYGVLLKTDPESRTFVTDRGLIRPEN